MAQLKGFLFDMDGTLVDNWMYHIVSFNEYLRRKNLTPIAELTLDLNGRHSNDIFRIMIGEEQCQRFGFETLNQEKEAVYRDMYSGYVEPINGLIELLKEAKARGIKCAIASSGCRENVEFIIEELGIADYIDGSISGSELTNGKPHPEAFLKAAATLNLQPEECIVFEDAVNGIKAGTAAGCKCVGITTTATVEALSEVGASICVKDFTSLSLARLEALLAE